MPMFSMEIHSLPVVDNKFAVKNPDAAQLIAREGGTSAWGRFRAFAGCTCHEPAGRGGTRPRGGVAIVVAPLSPVLDPRMAGASQSSLPDF